MKRVIRPLEASDIATLQQLDKQAHGEEWSTRTFTDEIEQDNRTHLVVEVGGTIAGHASMLIDGSSGRLTNVAVAPEHNGQGLASALLLELIHQVVSTAPVAYLQLEVRAANRRAQRLYSRFGFMPVGIERNFYTRGDALGNHDALVMAVTDVCSPAWRDRIAALAEAHPAVDEGAAA